MSLYVEPRGKKWIVRRSRNERVWRVFATNDEAKAFAMGKNEIVYLYDDAGMITERIIPSRIEAVLKRLANA